MAFEGISGGLQNIFKKLTGRGRLSEKDVKDAMREIRLVLLEADVNYLVVKDFVKRVTERAVGADVLESLTPGQQIIKIVNEEMTALMGATNARLDFGSTKPAIILMAGLQGAGKTTMCGKLAMLLKKQYGKNPLLCACDVYRPAAIDQLKVVGEKVGVPVFEKGQQWRSSFCSKPPSFGFSSLSTYMPARWARALWEPSSSTMMPSRSVSSRWGSSLPSTRAGVRASP